MIILCISSKCKIQKDDIDGQIILLEAKPSQFQRGEQIVENDNRHILKRMIKYRNTQAWIERKVRAMTLTREDLLALGNMFDEKIKPLDRKIDALGERMDGLESKVDALESKVEVLGERIDALEGKVEVLGERIDALESKVDALENKVEVLSDRVDTLEENVRTMRTDICVLTDRMDKVEDKVRMTNIILENDVIPRLQNIEGCYVSTYKRYQEGVNDIDKLKTDMSLVKKVVTRHSEILQTIS